MKLKLQPNEQVIKASDINRLFEESMINGKLVLTNQKRLYFKTQQESQKQLEKILAASEIRDIMYFKTGLFSKGLCLLSINGDVLRFKLKAHESLAKTLPRMI